MMADDWQTASTKQLGVWDLAPASASVLGQCEAVSATLHRLSTQGILLAECGTEDAKQAGGGVRQPVQPCPVHQIAN